LLYYEPPTTTHKKHTNIGMSCCTGYYITFPDESRMSVGQ